MKQYNYFTSQDLTFVVCAYKECKYLEDSVQSLINQTVKAKILISTSTPNKHIQKIAEQYGIDIRVNPKGGQIEDYNFAMAQADTELVMLMHQDEILKENFVESVLKELNVVKRPIIAFTNYIEMHDDEVDKTPSMLVRIKRIMLWPLHLRLLSGTWLGKRGIQIFGDPITHPTVVCVKKEMPEVIFKKEYKASMDWDLWERLSRQKGNFVYVKEVLLYHRMNNDNQTVKLLNTTNARYEEECEILGRFWPKVIARMIMKLYSKAANFY